MAISTNPDRSVEAQRAMVAIERAVRNNAFTATAKDAVTSLMSKGEYHAAFELARECLAAQAGYAMQDEAGNPIRGRNPANKPKPSKAQMLCMRMGWSDMDDAGPVGITVSTGQDGALVVPTIIKDDQVTTIEDRSGMFPCDETITKLRMLL